MSPEREFDRNCGGLTEVEVTTIDCCVAAAGFAAGCDTQRTLVHCDCVQVRTDPSKVGQATQTPCLWLLPRFLKEFKKMCQETSTQTSSRRATPTPGQG